jgi:hypothetical protein
MSFKAETVTNLKVDVYSFGDIVSEACAGTKTVFSNGAWEAVIVERRHHVTVGIRGSA